MVKFYTDDYGLSPEQLDDKYNPDGDGQHPGYPRVAWRLAVMSETTCTGYWAWVQHELHKEEDELSKDNPFNTPSIEDGYREYSVTWTIEVHARSHEEAAAKALEIQRDDKSTALCFLVESSGVAEVGQDVDLDFSIELGERPDNGNPVYTASAHGMAIFNPNFSSCGRFPVDPMVAYGMTPDFVDGLMRMNADAGYDASM